MNEHTPGPWTLKYDCGEVMITGDDETSVIWTGSFGDIGSCDKSADASLIAAAPELLEALEYCLQWLIPELEESFLTSATHRRLNLLVDTAQAAIAKATA